MCIAENSRAACITLPLVTINYFFFFLHFFLRFPLEIKSLRIREWTKIKKKINVTFRNEISPDVSFNVAARIHTSYKYIFVRRDGTVVTYVTLLSLDVRRRAKNSETQLFSFDFPLVNAYARRAKDSIRDYFLFKFFFFRGRHESGVHRVSYDDI
jgi:hypothetical protein